MFFRLLLLFTLVPFLELALLVWIASRTGFAFTMGLVVVTGILGAALARWQGWNAANRMRADLARGQMPTDSLLDGVMILVAGAMLLTPGVLTDAVGFALLVPPARRWIKRLVARRIQASFTVHSFTAERESAFGRDRIIDVKIVEPPTVEDASEESNEGR